MRVSVFCLQIGHSSPLRMSGSSSGSSLDCTSSSRAMKHCAKQVLFLTSPPIYLFLIHPTSFFFSFSLSFLILLFPILSFSLIRSVFSFLLSPFFLSSSSYASPLSYSFYLHNPFFLIFLMGIHAGYCAIRMYSPSPSFLFFLSFSLAISLRFFLMALFSPMHFFIRCMRGDDIASEMRE